MSSATSVVTYTFVYTDSEPGRAFWGADDEEVSEGGIPRVIILGYDGLPIEPVDPPSPDYIPGLEDPQTPPVPQDEDEREPMFVHAHDPDYVPEPIYPKYIPLEDEHEFPAEEQPLPPVDSPTDESPGYVTELDPEEDPEEYEDDEHKKEDGPVDYPMEDEDDKGTSRRAHSSGRLYKLLQEPVDEPVFPPEGTEPVIPPPSTDITIGARITVRPQTSISLPSEAEVERLLTMTTPSPSPILSHYHHPLRKSALPRWRQLHCIFKHHTTHHLGIQPNPDTQDTSTQPSLMQFTAEYLGRSGRGSSEIAPMTVGEVNTRVTELAELHEHDTHDLDGMEVSEEALCFLERLWLNSNSMSQTTHQELQTHRDHVYEARDEAYMQAVFASTREQQGEAGQPDQRARIPDHQDASGDADSHIQSDNKRKADDSSRNNHGHQQQPFKRQNVARSTIWGQAKRSRMGDLCPNAPSAIFTTMARAPKGNGAAPKGNGCFECGALGNAKKRGNAPGNPDANVITGTFLLNNHYASILFDTGADRSFISTAFSSLINIAPTPLENCYDVKLADEKLVGIDTIIRGCT
ncbi:putative reverse transcriptase domain-containing protein [Tanacetum coccineum]